jgi:phosphoenolpyruvate synthase/pyruvate phosphate dikinase
MRELPVAADYPSLTLRGIAAAPGKRIGRARTFVEGARTLCEGDVLICRTMPPSNVLLAARIGAVVADRGPVLSNRATLARELGIPTVIAPHAADVIRDGQYVLVDGDVGIVALAEPSLAGTLAPADDTAT